MAEALTLFSYRAQDDEGRERQGLYSASSPSEVQAWLAELTADPERRALQAFVEAAPAFEGTWPGISGLLAPSQGQ